MTFSKLWFIRSLSLLVLSLASVSAFAVDCNTSGFACTNLDTQIKGSRLPMWGTDSGSANAYAITTIAPLGPSLRTGSRFMFIATHASTSASTLAVDGGSAIAIKKNVSTALTSGDIALNQVIEVTYDGTNFQLVGPGLITNYSITINGQTCLLSGTCNVNNGASAHSVALNQGNGNAVTGLSLGAHQIPVGATSADPTAKTVPQCLDTGGNHLNFDQSTDALSCGSSSSGGGGGGGSISVPTNFTAVNGAIFNYNTNTVSVTGVECLAPGNNTLNWRFCDVALAAAPYTVTEQLDCKPSLGGIDSTVCGMYLYDGTKLEGFEALSQSSTTSSWALRVEHMATVSTDTATVCAVSNVTGTLMTLRVVDNSTTRVWSYSLDGSSFTTFCTVSSTNYSFIAPNKVGFGGLAIQGHTAYTSVRLLYWLITNP